MGKIEQCLKGRCYSPVACEGFGYCRERNLTKFTSGPWSVETVRTTCGHAHKINPIRACIYVDHRDARETDDKTVRAAANAHLIAAAPSLLEALAPFARVAEHDIGQDEADEDTFRPMSSRNQAPLLTVGDFRRALAAIREAGR